MKIESIQDARSKYSYPPAHVLNNGESLQFDTLKFVRPGHTETMTSSMKLDEYHRKLLDSKSHEDIRLGIASVQYWGRAFVKGRSNHNQAATRVGWLFHGNRRSSKTFFNEVSVNAVKSAINHANSGNYDDAYWSIREVPHFGVSFGSKLLAFCNPENIGIYDSHISRYVSEKSEFIRSTFKIHDSLEDFTLKYPTRFSKQDAPRFGNYCEMLSLIAKKMNQEGLKWRDWDNSERNWRAVDAERALFVLAQS
ncbi:hypothetical protein Y017_11220 [Alcanivorax sp. 97CO-5]|jgi:hypothetical protein|uniref:hypothetical protein n=1 Tax=unclassified Alcanivorax TaxID=2638842 RepID=UPI0003E7E867|nr:MULTISPECIES: hypothetical protein [unclassified Alcanivorax]EUC70200.1 hypothetical protein Y017_11220 [Alcanivorax sp. 97CO-5]PKG01772.1 hypothetical protein Y019_06125 [Alcanivorax sp. 97CO-6]